MTKLAMILVLAFLPLVVGAADSRVISNLRGKEIVLERATLNKVSGWDCNPCPPGLLPSDFFKSESSYMKKARKILQTSEATTVSAEAVSAPQACTAKNRCPFPNFEESQETAPQDLVDRCINNETARFSHLLNMESQTANDYSSHVERITIKVEVFPKDDGAQISTVAVSGSDNKYKIEFEIAIMAGKCLPVDYTGLGEALVGTSNTKPHVDGPPPVPQRSNH